MHTNENGLQIGKMRVALGVVGMIYEARPNVTVDAAILCLKAGNAVMLRGSKDILESNKKLVAIMQEALMRCGFDKYHCFIRRHLPCMCNGIHAIKWLFRCLNSPWWCRTDS